MVQPKGGRGKTVPYEQKHVRVPIPVLDSVKSIVDRYRASVLAGDEFEESNKPSCEDIDLCIKLVNKFCEEESISKESFSKPTRNNQNLKRFVEWLEQKKE
ncbi:MAG: hypothetical protein HC824_22000 [Synechococcales cyanobacterium RM1_1_8]|nr:hypothetical protein [Synechococcales cyanobacterium RM1_1_8]